LFSRLLSIWCWFLLFAVVCLLLGATFGRGVLWVPQDGETKFLLFSRLLVVAGALSLLTLLVLLPLALFVGRRLLRPILICLANIAGTVWFLLR